jgi:hypothetical protein
LTRKDKEPAMTRPRWLTIALFTTGALLCSNLWRASARRRAGRSPAKPEPLQVWENEGGGVPTTGGHTAGQVDPSRA